jgi:hypothetical protein
MKNFEPEEYEKETPKKIAKKGFDILVIVFWILFLVSFVGFFIMGPELPGFLLVIFFVGLLLWNGNRGY